MTGNGGAPQQPGAHRAVPNGEAFPLMIGDLFARWQERHHRDTHELARYLGVSLDVLHALAACPLPESNSQLREICEDLEVDQEALREVLWQAVSRHATRYSA